MSEACPERIAQARELAGLTKSELAEQVEVSVAAVTQWESGVKNPTAANAAAVARALKFPMPLLFRPLPVELSRKGPLTFRSWSSAATRKANRKSKRFAELVAEAFLWLEDKISFPDQTLPDVGCSELHSERIIEAATACRRAWNLGDRPILKLAELFESKGVLVSSTTFGDTRFDAFSCIINRRPFVFLGDDKEDRARSRFNAAHELGHLVLHQHHSEDDFLKTEIHKQVEHEANLFSAAFLMPRETFKFDVADATLNGFLKYKPKWGTSVQAMVRWSYELGLISHSQYEELFHQMSVKGWRRAQGEPLDDMIPQVAGTIGRKSLEMLQSEKVIQSWEIPTDIPLPLDVLCSVFQTDPTAFEPEKIIKFDPSILNPLTEN